MSANEIAAKVQELRELRRMADELYAKYTKQTTARRFCLA